MIDQTLLQDVRYALRGFARSPGFTAAALSILALGIGLNTVTFSLFDAIVLRSLPGVARPSELVSLDVRGMSYPSYTALRDGDIGFSGLAASSSGWLAFAGTGAAQRVRGTVVSGNYFTVLGVRPAAGRFFLATEERSGETVAVVSHALWQNHFGGSTSALGGVVNLNGVAFTVLGVAPAGFRGTEFGAPSDLWIPIGAWPRVATRPIAGLDYLSRNWGWLSAFGRLRPGIDLARAQNAVDLAARREAAEFPNDTPKDYRIPLESLARAAAGGGHSADPVRLLGLLLGAVGIVLLTACANLANLFLARAVGRRKEIAVRRALGAGRGRLVRQLMTESLALAVLGGGAGLLVATWSLNLVMSLPLPGDLTFAAFNPSLDGRVLAYSFGLSLMTGALVGLLPALQATRLDVLPALKDEPEGLSGSRWKGALVAAQVALCLVLLSCAGFFVRSLRNALQTDVGFEPRGVALTSVHLGLARYDAPRARRFVADLAERAAALPGVTSVAWAGILPLSGGALEETALIEGAPASESRSVDVAAVGPAYFATLRTPIVAGREFDPALDTFDGVPAVVVNQAAARRFWPSLSPVGRRLTIGGKLRTVVGVSRDSRFRSIRDASVPQVFLSADQLGGNAILSALTLLVRTAGDPHAALSPIRSEIAGLDRNLPPFGQRTLEESIGDLLLPQRLGSSLLGLFAVLSLLLAAIGVYGVVAGTVARRVREFGIRLALGARPGDLRRMVLRQTGAPLLAGVAVGLPLAVGAARLLAKFLYGVTPADAATFAAAALLLALGGLLAADLPARRAARIDPAVALRSE